MTKKEQMDIRKGVRAAFGFTIYHSSFENRG